MLFYYFVMALSWDAYSLLVGVVTRKRLQWHFQCGF